MGMVARRRSDGLPPQLEGSPLVPPPPSTSRARPSARTCSHCPLQQSSEKRPVPWACRQKAGRPGCDYTEIRCRRTASTSCGLPAARRGSTDKSRPAAVGWRAFRGTVRAAARRGRRGAAWSRGLQRPTVPAGGAAPKSGDSAAVRLGRSAANFVRDSCPPST